MTQPQTHWNSGLLDCCDDMNSCCYGFWCCPCFACTTSGKFGENDCLPLFDILSPAITAACGIPLCAPPAALSLRVAIRHKYGIKGSLCKDIGVSCFCSWCSWCQMSREIKHRKRSHAVINVQPQSAVVNTQPASNVVASQVHTINQQNIVLPASPTAPGFVLQPMSPGANYGSPLPSTSYGPPSYY